MKINVSQVGEPTGMPGIYAGISNAAYHSGPGISKSGLDKIARSPLHYWDAYLNPKRANRAETPAMAFGTAVHTAVLEPEEYLKRYWVMPKVDGRTTAGKAAKAEAEEAATTRNMTVIDDVTHAHVMSVSESVRNHPTIMPIFDNGVPELSVYWLDKDTGILCRCRPDWLGMDCVLDVKTTEDASPSAFQRSAYGWRYWVQAAYYLDGLAANGININAFVFAAVEKSSPYACSAFLASQGMLDAGRTEYKRLLRIYAKCVGANVWPGYDDHTVLEMPAWTTRVEGLADLDAEVF